MRDQFNLGYETEKGYDVNPNEAPLSPIDRDKAAQNLAEAVTDILRQYGGQLPVEQLFGHARGFVSGGDDEIILAVASIDTSMDSSGTIHLV